MERKVEEVTEGETERETEREREAEGPGKDFYSLPEFELEQELKSEKQIQKQIEKEKQKERMELWSGYKADCCSSGLGAGRGFAGYLSGWLQLNFNSGFYNRT
ncbi:MAG: hypothetical protein ACO3FI_10950 [Cyclobacteriaceae bacterium]